MYLLLTTGVKCNIYVHEISCRARVNTLCLMVELVVIPKASTTQSECWEEVSICVLMTENQKILWISVAERCHFNKLDNELTPTLLSTNPDSNLFQHQMSFPVTSLCWVITYFIHDMSLQLTPQHEKYQCGLQVQQLPIHPDLKSLITWTVVQFFWPF